jgi:hypothetical protein
MFAKLQAASPGPYRTLCTGILCTDRTGGEMDQEYFRRFALRCRELMLRTANERAKEQLCLWAAELDARAAAWGSGGDASVTGDPEIGQPGSPLSPASPSR